MNTIATRMVRLGAAALIPLGLVLGAASAVGASSSAAPPLFGVRVILAGSSLFHSFTPVGASDPSTEPLSDPDDITELGHAIFVGFQNGVGPQGQASTDGNLDSTVVELTQSGQAVAQWDVAGKTDGVTADTAAGLVIATVNEDANSSLYTIDPTAPAGEQVTHYNYSEALPHFGGTDAISIYEGQILISASAPGTTGTAAPQPTYPAVYVVSLNPASHIASVAPLFYDEDQATVANLDSPQLGEQVALALTDPDSNEVVPSGVRFAGDFMLTSQGDQEQIFVSDAGGPDQSLAVLSLTQSVDDTAWPTSPRGTLYSTDSTNDTVDAINGPFVSGQPLAVATPCGANSAPATCPAPGFPANYLATLNPLTGLVTAVQTVGAAYTPQGGLLFIPERAGRYGGASGGFAD
jgi:hypothetical protein